MLPTATQNLLDPWRTRIIKLRTKFRSWLNLGAVFVGLSLVSSIARAAELRDLCPTRPGLGTAPCIVDQGRLLVEVGVAGWTLEQSPDARTDTVLIADTLLRYGLSPVDELQVGWAPYGHVRERDKTIGTVGKRNGIGDVTIAYKRSLIGPDGEGLSVAIQPFVKLPVGRSPTGDGTWSAGILWPISYDVSEHLQLQATPELDAAPDENGHGRHASFGAVMGVGVATSERTGVTLELSAFREQDPARHFTELLAGASGTWQPNQDWQLDAGVIVGLNRNSPDLELTAGISRRF